MIFVLTIGTLCWSSASYQQRDRVQECTRVPPPSSSTIIVAELKFATTIRNAGKYLGNLVWVQPTFLFIAEAQCAMLSTKKVVSLVLTVDPLWCRTRTFGRAYTLRTSSTIIVAEERFATDLDYQIKVIAIVRRQIRFGKDLNWDPEKQSKWGENEMSELGSEEPWEDFEKCKTWQASHPKVQFCNSIKVVPTFFFNYGVCYWRSLCLGMIVSSMMDYIINEGSWWCN